ncbi:Propanoyl-CoA C-acyltransferase [Mycolicibacterium rhodesiae JS60]|nr:Propanoyl-CoA C-acyltransferase [Mycolicibacterium rhodesiae JS60]
MPQTCSTAIAAAFELAPGRYPDVSSYGMYRKVIREAFAEWGITPHDIDGVFAMPCGIALGETPDSFVHERILEDLGLRANVAECVNAGGATYSVMVMRAAAAIQAGQADAVLCIGAGKYPKVSAGGGEAQARLVSDIEFELPYGVFIPAIYALAARAYMATYGAKPADLARVAVSARKWALMHPEAIMRSKGAISVDDVLGSRPIVDPFHLLDCSVPCEGGGAVLVTTAERARQICDQPAYLLGYGERHTHCYVSQAPDLVRTGGIDTATKAFAMAGMTPSEVDVAEIYDAFTINPLMLLENLGFCEAGEAPALVESGATDPGGSLPLNTNGGLLSFGHGGDASGMSVLVEGVHQVMGRAGDRQVPDVETALVHTYGGMMASHATLLLGRREP